MKKVHLPKTSNGADQLEKQIEKEINNTDLLNTLVPNFRRLDDWPQDGRTPEKLWRDAFLKVVSMQLRMMRGDDFVTKAEIEREIAYFLEGASVPRDVYSYCMNAIHYALLETNRYLCNRDRRHVSIPSNQIRDTLAEEVIAAYKERGKLINQAFLEKLIPKASYRRGKYRDADKDRPDADAFIGSAGIYIAALVLLVEKVQRDDLSRCAYKECNRFFRQERSNHAYHEDRCRTTERNRNRNSEKRARENRKYNKW